MRTAAITWLICTTWACQVLSWSVNTTYLCSPVETVRWQRLRMTSLLCWRRKPEDKDWSWECSSRLDRPAKGWFQPWARGQRSSETVACNWAAELEGHLYRSHANPTWSQINQEIKRNSKERCWLKGSMRHVVIRDAKALTSLSQCRRNEVKVGEGHQSEDKLPSHSSKCRPGRSLVEVVLARRTSEEGQPNSEETARNFRPFYTLWDPLLCCRCM